jgi:hypothetical protein
VSYSRAGGGPARECSNGAWLGKSIVCSPTCPTLSAPPSSTGCAKYFIVEPFSYPDGTVFSEMSAWDTAPMIPFVVADSYWSVSRGQLVSSNPTQTDPCVALQPSGLILNAPTWVGNMKLTDPLNVEADVSAPAGGRAGVLFRVLNNGTYYRFSFTGGSCTPVLEVVSGFVMIRNSWGNSSVNVSSYCTPAGVPAHLAVHVVAASSTDLTAVITASINNVTVFSVRDRNIPSGGAGLWANSGGATFDNFTVRARAVGRCALAVALVNRLATPLLAFLSLPHSDRPRAGVGQLR